MSLGLNLSLPKKKIHAPKRSGHIACFPFFQHLGVICIFLFSQKVPKKIKQRQIGKNKEGKIKELTQQALYWGLGLASHFLYTCLII